METKREFFTREDAMKILPDLSAENMVTQKRFQLPLDPKFPEQGCHLPRKQLELMLGQLWPTLYFYSLRVVGQRPMRTYAAFALFGIANRDQHHRGPGFMHLWGPPGIGKTQLGTTIQETHKLVYKRIQCVADTIPSDILGSRIIDFAPDSGAALDDELEKSILVLGENDNTIAQFARVLAMGQIKANPRKEFKTLFGPAFANVLLADEANRMSPRSQSALLELPEGQVTLYGETYPNDVFVVMTSNPLDDFGTSDFSRALYDRIIYSVRGGGFTADQYAEILRMTQEAQELRLPNVGTFKDIQEVREYFHHNVHVSDNVRKYIGEILVRAKEPWAYQGLMHDLEQRPETEVLFKMFRSQEHASLIRASVMGRGITHLEGAARMIAVSNYRDYVTPDDVTKALLNTCAHRMDFALPLVEEYVAAKNISVISDARRFIASDILRVAEADARVAMLKAGVL